MENKLKRSKKFCVCLLDFFTCFILTLTLFFIGEAINTSLPSYNNQQNNIQQTQDNLTKIVLESKLSYLKEDNYLAQTTDVTYSYIIRQTYKQIDSQKKNNSFFKDTKDIDATNDSLYFYYQTYIVTHKNDYHDFSKLMNINQYKEKLFKNVKNEENEIFILENYPYFTNETANKIYSYLVEKNQDYLPTYQLIYNTYLNILEETINQYMELYTPYNNLLASYNQEIDTFYKIKITILLISYFIAITIIYFVFPCIFKDGKTLFMKLFSLKATSVENEQITWPFNIIKAICLFIIYMIIPSLVGIIVLGGYSGILMIFTYFLDIFNLFSLAILSILLIICSMLFTFTKKEKKQTFSEFASLMVVIEDPNPKSINVNGKTFIISQ